MPWIHSVSDPNEGHFDVCVESPGDTPPSGPATFAGPTTTRQYTIQPGAGWRHVEKRPPDSVPGSLFGVPRW